jgi:uridine phosphorylase
VVQKGSRLAIQEFAPFFKAAADGALVPELRAIYATLKASAPNLPSAGTKQAMTNALRDYEHNNPDKLTLIESNDEFYGVSKGSHKLSPFIQWVFVPAVKDACNEQ